jgi:uncharacterized membrane protein YkvA (DUF1232 family)
LARWCGARIREQVGCSRPVGNHPSDSERRPGLPLQEGITVNPSDPTTPRKDPGWLRQWINNLRLAWRLERDPQVPTWTKLIPVAALAYIVLPFDFVPDWILGPGQLDDLGLFLLGLRLLIDMAPPQIVQRHRSQMSSIEGTYRVVDEERPEDTGVAGYIDAESSTVSEGSSDTKSGGAAP